MGLLSSDVLLYSVMYGLVIFSILSILLLRKPLNQKNVTVKMKNILALLCQLWPPIFGSMEACTFKLLSSRWKFKWTCWGTARFWLDTAIYTFTSVFSLIQPKVRLYESQNALLSIFIVFNKIGSLFFSCTPYFSHNQP